MAHTQPRVVRVALQNAVSVAGTLLPAETTMPERKDEPGEHAAAEF